MVVSVEVVFDPDRIAREKRAARDADDEALRSGQKSADDLRRENSIFAPLPPLPIDLDGAQPLR